MSETQKQGTAMYTDEELCWATQIAYFNVEEFDIETYKKENGEYPTLEQVFNDLYEKLKEDIYFDPNLLKKSNLSGDNLKMQESAKQFLDDVIEGRVCKDWKLGDGREGMLNLAKLLEEYKNGTYDESQKWEYWIGGNEQ